MQKLRGEQTNIEEELLELQEGIEATANKVKKRLTEMKMTKWFLIFCYKKLLNWTFSHRFYLHMSVLKSSKNYMNLHLSRLLYGQHCWKRLI